MYHNMICTYVLFNGFHKKIRQKFGTMTYLLVLHISQETLITFLYHIKFITNQNNYKDYIYIYILLF
jgi:hypothetical protein